MRIPLILVCTFKHFIHFPPYKRSNYKRVTQAKGLNEPCRMKYSTKKREKEKKKKNKKEKRKEKSCPFLGRVMKRHIYPSFSILSRPRSPFLSRST